MMHILELAEHSLTEFSYFVTTSETAKQLQYECLVFCKTVNGNFI